MKGRGTWAGSIAALAFAAMAAVSGMDRLSERQVSAARAVPEALRSEAWISLAAEALGKGDGAGAQDLASRAVNASPLDPRGASLLAVSRLASGKREEAGRAFAAAERLGYRTPLVQAYFFDVALASGRADEAARRLDILLSAHPDLANTGYFFTALENSAEGQSVLVARLREDAAWSAAYLTGFRAPDDVLRGRARYLAQNSASAPLGCDRVDPMLRELARRGMRDEAARLARGQCPARALVQAVTDPGFEDIGEDPAFGWRRHGSGDVRIALVGEADRKIELENRSATTRLVLSQPVMLEAGEYRLFASVSGGRADAVMASLDCGTPQRPSGRGGSLGRGQLVRTGGCDVPTLGIWVRPSSGTVRLDNLRLSPVGAGAN